MSNTELRPEETFCKEQSETGRHTTVLIEPRQVPLGGVRAMNVRRTIPQRHRTLIGAWCFLDHYGPDEVDVTGGMNVPAHPHTGLQTVSWLFSGEILHRDSAGFEAFVKPGELNLMTAGSGISHSERSTEQTKTLHGVQLWIALPERSRHMKKTFEHFVPPVKHFSGGNAQVFLGELLGDKSPVETHTELLGAELNLEANATITIEIDAGFEHGILVDNGAVDIDFSGGKRTVRKDELLFSSTGATELNITNKDEATRLIILGGAPLGEEIVMWWNFIGRSHEEIETYRAAWQKEIGGPEDPYQTGPDVRTGARGLDVHLKGDAIRYGLPDGEPEAPLPAPPLPLAKLRPRA